MLRQIRSLHQSLTRDAHPSLLIQAIQVSNQSNGLLRYQTKLLINLHLVISKDDYCNSVLTGASRILISRLAVCPQCCYLSHFCIAEIWLNHSPSEKPTLVEDAAKNLILPLCVGHHGRYCTCIHCRISTISVQYWRTSSYPIYWWYWFILSLHFCCSHSSLEHSYSRPLDSLLPYVPVRNLGIYIESDVSMWTHVVRTVSSCFAISAASVDRSPVLVVSLVLPRMDYGSATVTGLPRQLLDRLQSVKNAAARLVFSVRKYDHITLLLRDLHWLRTPQRIEYRLAVLDYRCQHGLAPSYLSTQFHRVSDVESRRRFRSASTTALVVPRTHHQTIGDHAFPAATSRVWNSLSPAVTTSTSLTSFQRNLNTKLYVRSYPDA